MECDITYPYIRNLHRSRVFGRHRLVPLIPLSSSRLECAQQATLALFHPSLAVLWVGSPQPSFALHLSTRQGRNLDTRTSCEQAALELGFAGAEADGLDMASRKHRRVVWLCTLCTFVAYVERVGFPIAYAQLAKREAVGEGVEGAVMSSFFLGYALTQIPSSWISARIGLSNVLMSSFLSWSITSILTPLFCRTSAQLMVARVLVGASQGVFIPAVHSVLSQQVPPVERARAVSLATSGMYFGSAVAILVLPTIGKRLGPFAVFRTSGLAGLTWVLLWLWLAKDMVENVHGRRLPETKVSSGMNSRPELDGSKADPRLKPGYGAKQKFSVPRLLRCPAFWSIVVNNFTFHYTFYTALNWIPKYFGDGLGSDLASLGPLKALPYMIMFMMANVGGFAGDVLIFRHHYSVTAARKLVNTTGFVGAGIAVVMMSQANGTAAGLFWTSCLSGMLGLSRGGFAVNHMDIAPDHAGVLMGFSNTAGTLSGLIGVSTTGAMLELVGGVTNAASFFWPFFLCSLLCFFGTFLFELVGTGEVVFL